jgi:hypothetical protein
LIENKKGSRLVNQQAFFVYYVKNRFKTTASPIARQQVRKVVVMMFYDEIHIFFCF